MTTKEFKVRCKLNVARKALDRLTSSRNPSETLIALALGTIERLRIELWISRMRIRTYELKEITEIPLDRMQKIIQSSGRAYRGEERI